MKRKLFQLLCTVLCLALLSPMLISCGEEPSGTTKNSDKSEKNAEKDNIAKEGNESKSNILDALFPSDEKHKLVIATNASFPPYEYIEGSRLMGIDIELAQAIADKLGRKLTIVDTEFGSIIPGVITDTYDLGIAAIAPTEERLRTVNFTQTYAINEQTIIVRSNGNIKSLGDLEAAVDSGRKIGCRVNTIAETYASDTPACGGYGKDAVITYSTGTDAIAALRSGAVDAVIIDSSLVPSYVSSESSLTVLDTPYVYEEYAIAVSQRNPALRDELNEVIDVLIADGTISKIVNKYIIAD